MSKGTVRKKIFAKGARSSGGGDPTIPGRVANLENNEYKIAYFTEINSQTGTITIPTGATILLDQLPKGADALVSTKDATSGIPTGEAPKTTLAIEVDVATFDVAGNYTLTGDCSTYPVCLIYWLSIKAVDYSSLDINNILEEQLQYPKVLDLDYANVATATLAGDLIDGQFYRIINFPAFSSGIQFTDVVFQANYYQLASFPILSKFGTAYAGSDSYQVQLTIDWYNGGVTILEVYVPFLNNRITQTFGSTANAMDLLNWADPIKLKNATLIDVTLNKPASPPNFTIQDSIFESGVTIYCDLFADLNIEDSKVGSSSSLYCIKDGHTITTLNCESSATIYLPHNALAATDVGATAILGNTGLSYIDIINCSIGMNCQIAPITDNSQTITGCTWSNAKAHNTLASHSDKTWIGRYNNFDYTIDVDTAVSGGFVSLPLGYGIIYTTSGTGTPTSIDSGVDNIISHELQIINYDGTEIAFVTGGTIVIIGGLALVKLSSIGDNVVFIDLSFNGAYGINLISKY